MVSALCNYVCGIWGRVVVRGREQVIKPEKCNPILEILWLVGIPDTRWLLPSRREIYTHTSPTSCVLLIYFIIHLVLNYWLINCYSIPVDFGIFFGATIHYRHDIGLLCALLNWRRPITNFCLSCCNCSWCTWWNSATCPGRTLRRAICEPRTKCAMPSRPCR